MKGTAPDDETGFQLVADDETVMASVNLKDMAQKEYALIIAAYDSVGRLMKINQTTANAKTDGMLAAASSFMLNEIEGAAYVKAFLWDNATKVPELSSAQLTL